MGQELFASARERNAAIDENMGAGRQFQSMIGVLFNKKYRQTLGFVEFPERIKDLLRNERRQAERRLIK
jgi:hypothetical protein